MKGELHLGTQGWSYKSWVGNFYPADTTPDKYLPEYAKQFRAIEVDSTYYATPRPPTAKNWRAVTPENFRFTAKFPQAITHEKMLKDAHGETLQFLDTMRLLGDKLGPLLLQFPYQFKPDQKETLARFLETLPRDLRYALEVRHRGWLNEEFFKLLEQYRIAFVLADLSYMPKVIRVTTDFTYIRWLGDRRDIPDDHYDKVRIPRDREIAEWSDLISDYRDQGVAVWGFANNHYQGHSPATVRALMEQVK